MNEVGKKRSAGEIAIIFVLPILLWSLGLLSTSYRFFALTLMVFAAIAIVIRERWSWHDLGVRIDNLRTSIIAYALFTAAILLGIVILASLFEKNIQENWRQSSYFLYGGFVIISVPQEFLYRSFLMPKLRSLSNSAPIIIGMNAFLFALLHIIYPEAQSLFPLVFALGVGFSAMYYYFPNLIVLSLSHSIINFVAIINCFANFAPGCP